MALAVLDERHKKAVVLELKGCSKTDIARQVGVGRSTVFKWFDDPLVLAYKSRLQVEVDAARKRLFQAPLLLSLEVLKQALRNQLRDQCSAAEGDDTARTRTLELPTLVKLAREIEEIDIRLNPPKVNDGRATDETMDADIKGDVDRILSQVEYRLDPGEESKNTAGQA